MLNYLVPPVNVSGQFRLAEPLDALLSSDKSYTVTAVNTISEMLDNEIDVLNLVYIPLGLTEDDYDSDKNEDMPIVTLKSEDGAFYYIPAKYIASIPDITGHKFKRKIITLDLGLVPEDDDLQYLLDELTGKVVEMYGVNPAGEIMDASGTYIFTQADYDTFEADRRSNITNPNTCAVRLKTAEDKLEIMKKKIEALVSYINVNCPPS